MVGQTNYHRNSTRKDPPPSHQTRRRRRHHRSMAINRCSRSKTMLRIRSPPLKVKCSTPKLIIVRDNEEGENIDAMGNNGKEQYSHQK